MPKQALGTAKGNPETDSGALAINAGDVPNDLPEFLDFIRKRFGREADIMASEKVVRLTEALTTNFMDLEDDSRSLRIRLPHVTAASPAVGLYFENLICASGFKELPSKDQKKDKFEEKCYISEKYGQEYLYFSKYHTSDGGLVGPSDEFKFEREYRLFVRELGFQIKLRGRSGYWKNLDRLRGYIEATFFSSGLTLSLKDEFERKVHAVISELATANAAGLQSQMLPLSVPTQPAELYQGKIASGDIFKFLRTAYQHQPGAEPLTRAYLKKHDLKAYQALYNRERTETLPLDLRLPKRSEASDLLLASHAINLATAEGQEEARRVMNAINAKLYPRTDRQP